MPKTKKAASSSSDSDSGPDDRNVPPPSKKGKPAADTTATATKADPNKTQWTLEKLRQVNVQEFRGRKSVDIREFYEKDGKILPGKKGISLSMSQWKTLLSYADEITASIES